MTLARIFTYNILIFARIFNCNRFFPSTSTQIVLKSVMTVRTDACI
jgi:hypothetical protein